MSQPSGSVSPCLAAVARFSSQAPLRRAARRRRCASPSSLSRPSGRAVAAGGFGAGFASRSSRPDGRPSRCPRRSPAPRPGLVDPGAGGREESTRMPRTRPARRASRQPRPRGCACLHPRGPCPGASAAHPPGPAGRRSWTIWRPGQVKRRLERPARGQRRVADVRKRLDRARRRSNVDVVEPAARRGLGERSRAALSAPRGSDRRRLDGERGRARAIRSSLRTQMRVFLTGGHRLHRGPCGPQAARARR